MELREGGKGKENDSFNNIIKHNTCEGRGNKDMY
jgi:hypothetical protein